MGEREEIFSKYECARKKGITKNETRKQERERAELDRVSRERDELQRSLRTLEAADELLRKELKEAETGEQNGRNDRLFNGKQNKTDFFVESLILFL